MLSLSLEADQRNRLYQRTKKSKNHRGVRVGCKVALMALSWSNQVGSNGTRGSEKVLATVPLQSFNVGVLAVSSEVLCLNQQVQDEFTRRKSLRRMASCCLGCRTATMGSFGSRETRSRSGQYRCCLCDDRDSSSSSYWAKSTNKTFVARRQRPQDGDNLQLSFEAMRRGAMGEKGPTTFGNSRLCARARVCVFVFACCVLCLCIN